MNELYDHIKAIHAQIRELSRRTDGDFDDSSSTSMPKTMLETLKLSVEDTLRLFTGDRGDFDCHEMNVLDHGPTTPPLETEGATSCRATPDSGPYVRGDAATNKRRKKGVQCQKIRSSRRAEKFLPECLRNLAHPSIEDYTSIKVGSFMAANIMVMNLQKLQPKVEVVATIGRGAVLLLHEALLSSPVILSEQVGNGGLASLTAGAFWMLAKFGGVREVTPDASLICMAAGIHKKDLYAAELQILDALRWDLVAALTRHQHIEAMIQ
jgi:hypothetical protein